MKVDVFLRVAPLDWIRAGMAFSCLMAWKEMPGANLRLVAGDYGTSGAWENKMSQLHPFEARLLVGRNKMATFHWESRQYADENATTEPYILADDDRLPLGKDWVEKAVRYWEKYNWDHKYIMMCDRSALWMEDPGQGKRFEEMDLPVAEIPQWWGGANYLSYKGAVPYKDFWGPADCQDTDLGRWARENGKKQCFMMNCVVNHLGCGYSQVQPELYGRYSNCQSVSWFTSPGWTHIPPGTGQARKK